MVSGRPKPPGLSRGLFISPVPLDNPGMVRLRRVSYHTLPLRTRMPFRYGIAELREMPHLFVRAELEVAGQVSVGLSADNLPPKWFTKDPATTYADDLKDMATVIRAAGRHAIDVGNAPSVFDLWRHMYAAQKHWAAATPHPPLLWNFGVSLIERSIIDAFCRSRQFPFHAALRTGQLGLTDAGQLHPELASLRIADLLPPEPVRSVAVRHTVGLSDPLTDADLTPESRLDDGLPQTLEQSIRAYGLRYFKIKLSGDAARDRARLTDLATLLRTCPVPYAYTLDGNENYHDPDSFRSLWSTLTADPKLAGFLRRLVFIEQPLHRDVALCTDLGREFATALPPTVIDESDADLGSLPTALSLGYAGTTHKNCKGVFKSLANVCLLEHLRRAAAPGLPYLLSAEDLTNTGPVALPQDLAVLATLGIAHAERNGHHYLRGLSQFPADVQDALLAAHPDLYHRHPQGFATPLITDGRLSTASVTAAPFGYDVGLDVTRFATLE